MSILSCLSPRLRETAELLYLGLRNKDIAREMGLDIRTVRNYSSYIYDRTGTASRHELAVMIAYERR